MNHTTPGLPVHHQLLESTQTHVHCVGDAIQPSHPLSSPSPPALNLSQGLFNQSVSGSFQMSQLSTSGGQSIGVAASTSVLPINAQAWFPLGLTGLIPLQSKGLSRVFSSTTIGKNQLFSTQSSLWSNSWICTWLLGKPYLFKSHPFKFLWSLPYIGIDWHEHQGLNSISSKSLLLKGLSQSHLINTTKDTLISLIA